MSWRVATVTAAGASDRATAERVAVTTTACAATCAATCADVLPVCAAPGEDAARAPMATARRRSAGAVWRHPAR